MGKLFKSYRNVMFASSSNKRPINFVSEAKLIVFLNSNVAPLDGLQVNQSDFLQVKDFINNQWIIFEDVSSSDYREIREHIVETFDAADSIQHQVSRYLNQLGESVIAEVFNFKFVHEKDWNWAFNDSTPSQFLKGGKIKTNVNWTTNWLKWKKN